MGLSFTAPLAGRDDWEQPESTNPYKFQSTRPLRGATASASADLIVPLFQSTHPLRGATKKATQVQPARRISIHAPLAGRDERGLPTDRAGSKDFNPRAPCGARLFGSVAKNQGCDISIHAPLAGRDGSGKAPLPVPGNFNPRAPCGARRAHYRPFRPRHTISIHAPLAGRDDNDLKAVDDVIRISIHAPLAGRDQKSGCIC